MRDLILSSVVQGAANSGALFQVQAIVSEPGVLRLSDMVFQTWLNAGLPSGPIIDITPAVQIQRIEINGSTILMRGRENIGTGQLRQAPAAQFWSRRDQNLTGLPRPRVQSGDRVDVFAQYAMAGATGRATMSIPLEADRFRNDHDVLPSHLQWGVDEITFAGQPIPGNTADGVVNAFQIICDTDGYIDMTRFAVGMGMFPALNVNIGYGDISGAAEIQALSVRNDYQMVVNQPGAPVGTLGAFSATRLRHFFKLGTFKVVSGDAINVSVATVTGAGFDSVSASVPCIPMPGQAGTVSGASGCDPCK